MEKKWQDLREVFQALIENSVNTRDCEKSLATVSYRNTTNITLGLFIFLNVTTGRGADNYTRLDFEKRHMNANLETPLTTGTIDSRYLDFAYLD